VLGRQNEQEKEIERVRAEKARGNDTVIVRGAESITPAEDMREATRMVFHTGTRSC
jgi:hypothetical protein